MLLMSRYLRTKTKSVFSQGYKESLKQWDAFHPFYFYQIFSINHIANLHCLILRIILDDKEASRIYIAIQFIILIFYVIIKWSVMLHL